MASNLCNYLTEKLVFLLLLSSNHSMYDVCNSFEEGNTLKVCFPYMYPRFSTKESLVAFAVVLCYVGAVSMLRYGKMYYTMVEVTSIMYYTA